jgi:hypothetical protein
MPWREARGANLATSQRRKLDGGGTTVTTRLLSVGMAAGQRA